MFVKNVSLLLQQRFCMGLTLNLSGIGLSSKFYNFSMLTIADIQILYCTQFVEMFIIHWLAKFYMPSFNESLIFTIKSKAKENVAISHKNYYLSRS
jgi:hypothetical protein